MKIPAHYLTAILIAVPVTSSALTFNPVPTGGMSQDAIDGFELAADYWENTLADDVTINIDIDFSTLGTGILGSAGSVKQQLLISDYFTALGGDATSAIDATALANLPTLSGGFYLDHRTQVNTEGGSLVVSLDDNDSANNAVLNINTANAKAIGVWDGAASSDANITFSDAFSWDFDNSDGVDAGKQDFVGVAIHEIGHALGFVSGVDTVDFAIANSLDLEGFRVYSGLDMFRYSAADGIVDLSVGTASYFSVDGGSTNLGLFSTGSSYGDGRQASHWKDNLGLGIMDPTANPAGNINTVSALDLQAFDVMGWDLLMVAVPEPSTGALLLGSAIALCGFRRRS